MSALNPVMRVGDQIEEAVGAHAAARRRARAARRAIELLDRVGIPGRSGGCATTRTSSAAGCASAC